jgi:hypothetical protein
MAKFLRRSEIVRAMHYSHAYEWADLPGAGFGFECDSTGTIKPLNPVAQKSLEMCRKGADESGRRIIDKGIQSYESSYREPAAIECNCCSTEVVLADCMTNRCACGAFYNGSGQQLAHPSQWGEETGERFDDNGNQIL